MGSVSRPTPRLARAAIVIAALAAPLACNVFASLDRCHADSDCPSGSVCDPEGRFCLRADAGPPPPDASVDADADLPDAPDATPPPCNRDLPFETPTLVGGLDAFTVYSARLTSDEKTVLFSRLNGGTGDEFVDIFTAGRPARDAPFNPSTILPTVNTSASSDYWPTLDKKGTLLYFESSRSLAKDAGEYTNDRARIWFASKLSGPAGFGEPVIQTLFATTTDGVESAPYLHPEGRSLYFVSLDRPPRVGNFDIFVAKLDGNGIATEISNVNAVNTDDAEHAPVVSLDDKVLFFAREDGATIRDIYMATRKSPDGTFGDVSAVTELNTVDYEEYPSWVSDDLCRLYFVSTRPADGDAATAGTYRLWVASRPLK